jgi:hypothetical protein
MSESSEEQTAWTYQSDFLREARNLTHRVFFRLGIEDSPRLGFAAVGWWRNEEYKHPPINDLDPHMLWRPNPVGWLDAIQAKASESSQAKSLLLWAKRASGSTVDFHDVIADELQAHDAASLTYSFVSDGARVGSYDCVFVLECKREVFDALPHVVRSLPSRNRPLRVGLLDAVIESLLDRLANEARKGNSGLRGRIRTHERDVEDILRDAGSRLFSDLQLAVWEEFHLHENLFEQINAIASLRYESSEPNATIVFGKKDHDGPFEFRFRNEVSLSEAVWARKAIQLASDGFCMFSDTESLLGLVHREKHSPGEFWIRLKGQSQWEFGIENKLLANVHFGIPSFPVRRLSQQQFESTFKRVFVSHDNEGIKRIWALIENVLARSHGALIVVAEKADEEAERLSLQATSIEPKQLSGDSASRATAIDGAILLDPAGTCHAIGVILDGKAHPLGTPSRGARFNSAVRYVGAKEDARRLAVVISEDGQVDLLPRLRPRIKRSEFFEYLDAFLSHPKDEPLPAEVRDYCLKLVRHHNFYVQFYVEEFLRQNFPELDDAGRKKFRLHAFVRLDIRERPDGIPLQYDLHETDFIEDIPDDEEEANSTLPDSEGSSSES